MDLYREKSSISISPFHNSVVCCLAGENSTLHQNRSLYFINELKKKCKIEDTLFSRDSENNKPCAVIITVGDSYSSIALDACSKICQPIQYLDIRGPNRSRNAHYLDLDLLSFLADLRTYPFDSCHLIFDDRTVLDFRKFDDLSVIQYSFTKCTGIASLRLQDCNIPQNFLKELKKNKEIVQLTIMQCGWSVCDQVTLCRQLKYLTKLEDLKLNKITSKDAIFLAINSGTFSQLTRLRTLVLSSCGLSAHLMIQLMKQLTGGPLELLDVSGNYLKGSIHELSQVRQVNYPHLKKGCFYRCKLDRSDLIGLRLLIQEHKLPALKQLEISDNHMEKKLDVLKKLEKLIQSCEHMSNSRQGKVYDPKLRIYLNVRRRQSKCLEETDDIWPL